MNKLCKASRAFIETYKAEDRKDNVDRLFSFVEEVKDNGCEFTNGGGCVKRSKEYYDRLIETIILAVEKFEPWICRQYEKHGGLKPEFVRGDTILGRYLSDGNSPVYKWFYVKSCICQTCYREYGQPYYRINCKHDDSFPEWKNT